MDLKKQSFEMKKLIAEMAKELTDQKNKAKKAAVASNASADKAYGAFMKTVLTYNAEAKAYNVAVAAAEKELKDGFAAARADYMAMVKDTDGLTSVKPSVVKALEKYRDTADDKFLDEALGHLAKHRDEVLKSAGKTDKKAARFAAEIDNMIKAGS